jgi:hypothetical protein
MRVTAWIDDCAAVTAMRSSSAFETKEPDEEIPNPLSSSDERKNPLAAPSAKIPYRPSLAAIAARLRTPRKTDSEQGNPETQNLQLCDTERVIFPIDIHGTPVGDVSGAVVAVVAYRIVKKTVPDRARVLVSNLALCAKM